MSTYEILPKWHRELNIFTRIKPVLMLEGNILDVYRYPVEGSISKGSILRLPDYLHYYLKDMGYQNIVFYDNLRGFYNHSEEGFLDSFARMINSKIENGFIRAEFSARGTPASTIVRTALSQFNIATAIVMDFASRYISTPNNLAQNEVDSLAVLQQAALEASDVKTENGTLKNLAILVVNKINDIPAWFYLENPSVKTITIGTPSKEEREQLIKGRVFANFFASDVYMQDNAYYKEYPQELEKIQDRFVALTEGFGFTEINGLRLLCKNERIQMKDLCSVVDLYRYGIKENPWRSLDMQSLRSAKTVFERRVKGQDIAITKTLDVIKRAVTGMAGLQHSSHTKPKGVLFFAGPTGTGKTETAKTLAELLFGDESCCIRFDMSEYGQSHSDQKLLGAPPGYVGYESGGQLTNAVKNNPFSILLFDEIEKAHPSILDKFLQILEDGRMTDGQGNTVYFSETVIIFTSNLGVFTHNSITGKREPNVSQEMSYDDVQSRIRLAIEEFFKLELGRPEILNRIGENIVIFDYIRPEVAEMILDAQIDKIKQNLSTEKRISLSLSSIARETLLESALKNLSNGGRGIGNIVESMLINPLSRYMFDEGVFSDSSITINEISNMENAYTLLCTQEKA